MCVCVCVSTSTTGFLHKWQKDIGRNVILIVIQSLQVRTAVRDSDKCYTVITLQERTIAKDSGECYSYTVKFTRKDNSKTCICLMKTFFLCLYTSVCILYLFILQLVCLQSHFHRLAVVAIIMLFSPLLYLRYMQQEPAVASNHLGLFCCCMSVCCYASPMTSVVCMIITELNYRQDFEEILRSI